jgi:CRP-like cAMP-binding protein
VSRKLVQKLRHFAPLSDGEIAALGRLVAGERKLSRHQDLIQHGTPPDGIAILLDGMACRYKLLADGRRQFLHYMVPGDLAGTDLGGLKEMGNFLTTFAPSRVAVAAQADIAALVGKFPRLGQALLWCARVNEAISQEWIVNLGQRTALERAAHLICELYYRLLTVGLVEDGGFSMPVTQVELGDTLGLSTVHVNRTLQELRRRQLIDLRGKYIRVLDLRALEDTGLFNKAYLRLNDRLLADQGDAQQYG